MLKTVQIQIKQNHFFQFSINDSVCTATNLFTECGGLEPDSS